MKMSILLIFICFVASVYSLPTIDDDDLQNYQELQEHSMDYEGHDIQNRLIMGDICPRGRTRAPWGKCIPCGRTVNIDQVWDQAFLLDAAEIQRNVLREQDRNNRKQCHYYHWT
ncbi:unnamed protein product [Pieris macdunnoughi]|uniref:Secreted protein n=1 Tax=Pieris macdunnoughi TaxID=345717 RepID=A0A821U9B9_9NEOP|nr:unnamed protein product [Pieris macdunnoughi]